MALCVFFILFYFERNFQWHCVVKIGGEEHCYKRTIYGHVCECWCPLLLHLWLVTRLSLDCYKMSSLNSKYFINVIC